MIDHALTFLMDTINAYLKMRTDPGLGIGVELGRLVNDTGGPGAEVGKLRMAVVNVEEERVMRDQLPEYRYIQDQHVKVEPPVKLNIVVMIAANSTRYEDAWRNLALVMTCLQAHPYFSVEEYPALNPDIERLVVELQSLSFEQLNQLWAFVGGKQYPSIAYKIRLVALQDITTSALQPPITTITSNLHRA